MKNTIKIQTDHQNQFSGFLMDHLGYLIFTIDQDLDLKVNFYLKPLIQTIKLIMDLGEAEHTSDWDPSIQIRYWDKQGTIIQFETEPGYYEMQISVEHLILEDFSNNSQFWVEADDIQKDSHHIIPIKDIHYIKLLRN